MRLTLKPCQAELVFAVRQLGLREQGKLLTWRGHLPTPGTWPLLPTSWQETVLWVWPYQLAAFSGRETRIEHLGFPPGIPVDDGLV